MAETIKIRPQPKQEAFLASPADIVIFGGASYGGKSWALLMEPLRHVHNRLFGAVCFRRTYPEIVGEGGLWEDSEKLYLPPPQLAEPNFSRLLWRFPSGARVRFAHLQREADLKKYDGWQIALLMFDQLEHFSEREVFYLLSRNRTDCGIKAYCRASCNPDPESWLAKFLSWWIDDKGFPIEARSGKLRWFVRTDNEVVWADYPGQLIEHVPDGERLEDAVKSMTFVPSYPEDNPIGLALNPGYLANLRALMWVDMMRRLLGNWHARPSAGKLVSRDWFTVVPSFPAKGGQATLFWDFAATAKKATKKDPDHTAGVLTIKQPTRKVGQLKIPGRFCIANMRDEQIGPVEIDAMFVSFSRQCATWCKQHGIRYRVRWEQEPGSASIRESRRYVLMLAGLDAAGVRPVGDKIERARPFMAQAKAKNVDVLEGEWNEAWLSHEHNQPESRHDDIFDATSGSFNDVVKNWRKKHYHGMV